jgi:hypothetical protein
MALSDFELFIQERLRTWDSNVDISPGSPIDTSVIQPLLHRLGSDPFTLDLAAFIQDRLAQEFPELASKEGDALTDLLIKPLLLLWDPIVREIQRVKNNQSFKNPEILTTEEAESLGANIFATRDTGNRTRGVARIYVAQAQNLSVTQSNFFTSRSGLHFFPTDVQSIRLDEILFNVEGTLYYFDVNVVAEKSGDEYNIDVDELVTIANLSAAVRITNKVRFRFGLPAETAVDFIGRTEQELSEKSLVTLRGIAAKIGRDFSEVTRLGVVGFNDPEMQRDVVSGGGLGPILAYPTLAGGFAEASPDGEFAAKTRRVKMPSFPGDFTALIGSAGSEPKGFVITLMEAFGFGAVPGTRDLDILRVIDDKTIELVDQVVDYAAVGIPWTLRKRSLTLSGIPGGILFPSGPNGAVEVPDGQIHIGGATDILVRGAAFDQASVILNDIVDDDPLVQGTALSVVDAIGNVSLGDFLLGTSYAIDDETYQAFVNAKTFQYTIQIRDTPIAGTYRVLSVAQFLGSPPILTLDPPPAFVGGTFRWRLLDVLDVDLVEPKETRVSGADLKSVQNVDFLESALGTDFDAYGVAPGDVVRILNTTVAGDYVVKQVLSPFFNRVQIDRPLASTHSSLSYIIFRKNAEGGVSLPFVRITSIDLLDSSGQPIGSTIPYAKPIDGRSRAFANTSRGVKVEVRDATLGIVTRDLTASGTRNVNGQQFVFKWTSGSVNYTATCLFGGVNPLTVDDMVGQINVAILVATGIPSAAYKIIDGAKTRIGIPPLGRNMRIDGATSTASPTVFGDAQTRSSRDIRSASIDALGGWSAVTPTIDSTLDAVNVLDGLQVGFYSSLTVGGTGAGFALITAERDFNPDVNRFIQEGARSVGSARLFFLDPTSIEFDTSSRFSLVLPTGITLKYLPDPTLSTQLIPALPNGVKSKDGTSTASGTVFGSASIDFIHKGIRPGDRLMIDYVPVTGTAPLADPVLTLALKTLILSIDGGLNKVITFVKDVATAGAVSRNAVATQINQIVGRTICKIVVVAGSSYLEFEADAEIVIRKEGTANALLGFSTTVDTTNNSRHKQSGGYTITAVAAHTLTVSPPFPVSVPAGLTREQFKVLRPGAQRVGSTTMSAQSADAGLYYADIELVSEGTGDLWNVEADLAMTTEGYRSDGYWLTVDDSNLTFSPVEKTHIHFSRSILEVGVDDDPDNATQISGQNARVNYERSSVVNNVQNFIMSETERVVNQSPLARHLVPHFVRFDLNYTGGSKESEVLPDVEKYIREILPQDRLESSDVQKLVSDKGATSIQNPIDLLAVVHPVDRQVFIDRSSDGLGTGRLAAFIPDRVTIKRRLA